MKTVGPPRFQDDCEDSFVLILFKPLFPLPFCGEIKTTSGLCAPFSSKTKSIETSLNSSVSYFKLTPPHTHTHTHTHLTTHSPPWNIQKTRWGKKSFPDLTVIILETVHGLCFWCHDFLNPKSSAVVSNHHPHHPPPSPHPVDRRRDGEIIKYVFVSLFLEVVMMRQRTLMKRYQ